MWTEFLILKGKKKSVRFTGSVVTDSPTPSFYLQFKEGVVLLIPNNKQKGVIMLSS